jgi:type IV secretory pathway VirB9-like protein
MKALLIVCILLFVAVCFFNAGQSSNSANKPATNINASEQPAEQTEATRPLKVSAMKLYADYRSNEVAADNVYKGRLLAVQGIVVSINKDFLDKVYVELAAPDEIESVQAHLGEGNESNAAALQRGESVSLLCTGGGMIISSPMLEKCSFYNAQDRSQTVANTSSVTVADNTQVSQPAEEKIATVFGGDTVDWVFDGGHVASRFISVKPKLANTTTDIHIVSDHGNEYTLQLKEISSDADTHFDSKIFIVPGDKAAKDRLNNLPVFVPADELDKAKQDAIVAKAAQTAELKAEETKAETYRSQYPGSLHFDFTWDQKKGKELGLQQIWHDDKFTYLRGQFQETPALYELKDGKGSLINFDYDAGLYTVPKELNNGYLAIGKKKVEFHRTANATGEKN